MSNSKQQQSTDDTRDQLIALAMERIMLDEEIQEIEERLETTNTSTGTAKARENSHDS